MAMKRRAAMSALWRLADISDRACVNVRYSGAKRTSVNHVFMSAFDPKHSKCSLLQEVRYGRKRVTNRRPTLHFAANG